MSGGTRASLAGVVPRPLRLPRRAASQHRARRASACARFRVGCEGPRRRCPSGSSEHFALPRVAPQLREVNAYLGWFGPASRAMQAFSAGTALGMKVPGAAKLWDAAAGRFVKGSTGGPDAAARAKVGLAHRGHRLRRGGPRALRGARDRRGRLHLHRPHPGLGGGAGRRGRAAGHGRARARRTASDSTRWSTAAARRASPRRRDRRARSRSRQPRPRGAPA